ncbi:protein IQ-DOMAIN 14 [Dorcoceras hygrometricum]|uniref:Protein IQ-DOMAIN 14 n=1 Tax=Dorcoceras hygrometricum TaxID=472368 RepID=A0A2Z7CBZ4_9LAMI|nr:protein IQ-DOMAIN 14 [Dorcoceras hygrometricum]
MLKRLFISETHSRFEKKEKKKRWMFKLLKTKQLAPLSAPRQTPPCEADAEQCEFAATVPVETVAPDVRSLTTSSNYVHQQRNEDQESAELNVHVNSPELRYQDFAATRIQAAFRGYLGRKALRALRGVVKLQALIRGWAVRQQAMNTLKCLQSIVTIQTEVCSKRSERSKDSAHCQEYKLQEFGEKDIKASLQISFQKRWDDSTLTKKESKAIFFSKREAAIKRERIKEYYMNHRRSVESEREKVYGRQRYWLEQWVDAQLAKRDELGNLDRTLPVNARNRDELGDRQFNLRYSQKQHQVGMPDSPVFTPKRQFHHRKQRSTGDDFSCTASPVIPAYMASTKSAKAKARSLSSPRLRPINSDVCSEINSPHKHYLSPISSINSELTSISWLRNPVSLSQRSPRLKGLQGPIKSTISIKDLHLDSGDSITRWDWRCTNELSANLIKR